MIYPQDIINSINDNDTLLIYKDYLTNYYDVNLCKNKQEMSDDIFAFEKFMINEGYLSNESIRRYLFFLASMYDVFEKIYDYYPRVNTNSTHKDDLSCTGTAPFELFFHAMYIYYLSSYDVEGDVIECGSFKGFSSCCLSWICNVLNKKLFIADSFEGLPHSSHDPYYKKGDFLGTLEEVKTNMEVFGRPENVEYIKGFFSESLPDFDRKISLLWMDVDLYESATDVLENLYKHLSPGAVILSHELFKERDFEDNLLKPTIGPAKALYDFFKKNNIKYQAMPLENGTGLIIPDSSKNYLSMSLEHGRYLRDNCRKNVLSFQNTLAEFDTCSAVLNSNSWRIYQKLLNIKNSFTKIIN